LKTQDYREVEEYKSIFENATEGIFQSTIEGRFLKVNPAMARIFGYDSPEDMVTSITDIPKQIYVEEESRKKFLEEISKRGQLENFEARNYRKDRSIIWTRTNARSVRDDKGDILYFEGFLTDITAQKEADLALHESEQRYRSLVDHLPGVVFLDAPDDLEKTVYISPKIQDILGYSQEEWLSTVIWSNCIHPDDRDRVLAEKKRTAKTGESFRQEYRLRNKEDEYVWVREESSLVHDAHGESLFWQGFFLDITDQKLAEYAILRSEKQFTKIFRSNPIASTITTFDEGKYIDANQAYYDLSGYQPDELIGRSSVDLGFITESERQKFTTELREKKSIKGVESHIVTKDGVSLNSLEFYEIIRLRDKDYILATYHDITGRVTALRSLQESEERYRSLVELSPEAIAVHSEGQIIFANSAAMKLMGATSADELIGKSVFEILHPGSREFAQKRIQEALKSGETAPLADEKFIKLNGDVIDVEITSQPINFGGKKALQVFVRDITERKRIEEQLQASESRYRALSEASNDMIFIIGKSGNLEYVNSSAAKQFGVEPEALVNKTVEGIFPPETAQRQRNNLQKVLESAQSLYVEEKTSFPEKQVWLGTWLVPLKDENGNTISVMGVSRDITERIKAEEALKANEQRLRRIIESTTNVYYSHTPDHHLTYMSPQVRDILGYETEEALIYWQEFLTDNPINQEGIELTQKAIDTGEHQQPYILELKHKDGHNVWVEVRESPIVHNGKTVEIVGALTDITERKRAEEILSRQLEELTILHNVAVAGASSKDVDELIQRVTDTIGNTLYPDNCGVELVSESGDKILPHQSYRNHKQDPPRWVMTLDEGICGKVVRTGQSVLLGDVEQEPAYIEVTPGIQSELCVPIKIQGQVIGVVNVESRKPDAYSKADERLLNTVAGTMATAIERLRLFETSQRRLQELTILNAVGQASTDAISVDELIEKVTQIIGESIYPDNFGVLLLNKEGTSLIPHSSYRGISTENFPKYVSLGQGISGEVAVTGNPIRVANVRTHKKYIEVTSQVRSELCVPIKHTDQVLGVINAESVRINAFTEDDEQLLTTIANTLATAMEKLRLLEEEKKRRQEAEALREATAALTTSIEIDSLYEIILDSVTKLVPFDSASIGIFDQGYIKIVAGRSLNDNKICVDTKYLFDTSRLENPESLREPIIVPDVRYDDQFEKHEDTEFIRGWMAVPMVVHDQLIGFLNFDSSQPNFYTKEHAALAQTFGHQAAIAIENARLFQEESRRSQIIEAMANITNEFATAHEIMPALEKITKRSLELLHASTVAIYMLQDDDDTIKVVTALGAYREQLISHTLQFGTGITGNIIAAGKPEIINDMSKDSRRVKVPGTPEDDAQRDTIMSAPLILRGKPIGAINAWRQRSSGLFNESELNFLVSIANQTSMLIESIRLFQETARRAQEAHAIAEVGRDISSTLKLDIVLERIAQYAKELLRAETSAVYLSSPEDALLQAIAAIGVDSQEIKDDPLPLGSGILGNIALQKSGEIVNDTLGDSRAVIVKGTECHPNEHLMGVPVLSKDQLTGLLAVWRTGEGKEFKPFELDFLSSLGQQAAVAIENARLFEVEQRRFQEAETLRQTSEAITSSLDIQQVLTLTLDNLNRVVPFDSASVFLIENENVRLTAVKGMPDGEDSTGKLFPIDDTLLQEISETRLPLILSDAKNDTRFKQWITDQVHGWLGVPLIARGIIIGYLTIDSREVGAYSEHDANLAMTFAHQAAVAIENARLYERGEAQIRQLTVLRDVDSAISSSFDLRVTLNLLLGYAIKELNADAAAILLYNADLKSLSLYTNTGFTRKHSFATSHIRIGEGLAGRVVLQRKLVHIGDLNNTTDFSPGDILTEENFNSYFGVPLIAKGQIKGVLELYTREVTYPDPEWLNFLQTLAGQAAIAIDNVQLFKNLQQSNQELILAYDTTLAGWGKALELRDKETQGHTDRVVAMTIELARRIGIAGEELTNVMRGTLLHDIGKMGIPDHILHKPGPLTEEEWDIMRRHPQFAYDLIHPIPYLRPSLDIPYAHHERWDGSGYPRGLKGEDIPLAARIFAVVDIWDALLNNRVYREAWAEEKVLEYLKNAAGIELDPDIVEKFLEMIQEDQHKNRAE